MRVLITGVSGFVGGHLADALLARGITSLFGIVGPRSRLRPELQAKVTSFEGDLCQAAFVDHVMTQAQPDYIYHLAGQASVSAAWGDPWPSFEINVRPQVNLFAAMLRQSSPARFLSITSSKVYGEAADLPMPIHEGLPLHPDNPYGVSKAAQDLLAQQYFLSHQLPIIRVRPFNHIGPGQSPDFVSAAFARQIARAEAGQQPPEMKVGNLAAERDFSDVRDVVQAYIALMDRGEPGQVYNVGSGRAVPVQQLLDILLSLARVDIKVVPDPARMRPADQPLSYGDISKIQQHVNWQPRISLETSLRDILDDWRQQVRQTPE